MLKVSTSSFNILLFYYSFILFAIISVLSFQGLTRNIQQILDVSAANADPQDAIPVTRSDPNIDTENESVNAEDQSKIDTKSQINAKFTRHPCPSPNTDYASSL